MVAGSRRSCLVISCRMSHFGMNPERGGRPPNESRVSKEMSESSGDLVADTEIELIFVELSVLNKRNIEVVMMM